MPKNQTTNLDDAELYIKHSRQKHLNVKLDALPIENEEEIPIGDIDYMYDVPLPMIAEIGSIEKTVREVLQMKSGDIIQFNKIIGEPLEILIGDCMMCRGEIVVVNEHYGIRISEVVRVTL